MVIQKRGAVENCLKLPVLCDKSHKGFKEKDAMKNACDGFATALVAASAYI